MESTRLRRHVPILPRIEDLEQSHQWTGLECDINNLERLSVNDRSRWRKSTLNRLENLPRGSRAIQRHSMPEATKLDRVYVRMTNSENVRSTREKIDDPEQRTRLEDRTKLIDARNVEACSWKPRTEFERNYFGMTENVVAKCFSKDETNRRINENCSPSKSNIFANTAYNEDTTKSPLSGYYRTADDIGQDLDHNEKMTMARYVDNHRPRSSGSIRQSDRNISNLANNERRKTCNLDSSFCLKNPRIPKVHRDTREMRENNSGDLSGNYENGKIQLSSRRSANEDDSSEYRGSRERLHEIFEHNRFLRRQFFANMPGGDDNNNTRIIKSTNSNDDDDRQDTRVNDDEKNPPRDMSNDTTTMRNRLDFQKNLGISGFGSTETLTSQSNQSGASSTNGRKSRVEFGNSPEPSEDPRMFGKIGTSGATIGFSSTKNDDSRDGVDHQTASFRCDFLPLPSKSAIEYQSSSCDDINENDVYDDELESRRISRERLKESPIDAETDFSLKNPSSISENRRRTDSIDSDKKFFATYVNVDELSQSISNVSSPRPIDETRAEKKKIVSQSLDLTTIDQRSNERLVREREYLKNYTVEVTPFRDYERSSRGILTVLGDDDCHSKGKATILPNKENDSTVLRGCKSLLELSANLSRSPSTSLENEPRIDSTNVRGKSRGNDFSSTIDDLRSPQLVNNFSNSLNDLVDRVDDDTVNQRSSRNFQDNSEEDDVEESRRDSSPDSVRRKSEVDSTTPGNGTTLPLVYGPIPYKSPRRYVEGEVTIHYRSPVRQEAKEILSEEELARRSAENMRRVYQEERRRKYLQELHDIDSRRHTDNFVPSQKSPIPLNRYDDFVDDLSYRSRSQEQTPEPRHVARALYNFVGQSSRELTFRRGDLIFVRRQVDKNWYEGEHNAMIGLFPFNYVEILPYDGIRTTPKKPYEGQARAKFNFVAQTNLELSLAKGDLVVVTRRVDENWYEGRIGNRKGIFPISYVEVIAEPGHISETPMQSSKPVASPAAHSLLSNGTAGGKMSMGAHHYTPSIPVNTSTTQPHYNSLPRMGGNKLHVAPVNETLHIDTHSETIPYRALYNYRPQNEDELELKEGDTVYVMEKCDDGWYVGSSQRTGYFGTFPGNYVERL